MGTHDRIVEKATAMGKTFKDFTEAAQSHKKAIVFWLVLAFLGTGLGTALRRSCCLRDCANY